MLKNQIALFPSAMSDADDNSVAHAIREGMNDFAILRAPRSTTWFRGCLWSGRKTHQEVQDV